MKHKKTYIFSGIFILLIATAIVISAFGINSHIINVREETIRSQKIDKNLNGLIIAYFSDLNYGNNLTDEDLEIISNNINKFNPDIIIFGGDLVSERCVDTSRVNSFLTGLKASIGKYAILGDEDIYRDDVKEIYNDCDFVLLNNSNQRIFYNYSNINLVGIEPSVKGNPDITNSFDGVNNDYYTIAITHCPDLAKEINSDYILSGHSLGGQVYIPLVNYLYRPLGAKTYLRGKHQVNNGTLDISNGLGTLDKDVRLFSKPEIVIYKLKG